MAPTEYRVIAKRATLRGLIDLRGAVAAGEALNPEVLGAWHEATNVWVRDGYGQTETGQLTGMPLGIPARPGSMGIAAARGAARRRRRRARRRPRTIPTFFLRYLGEDPRRPTAWRTGDRVSATSEGFLHFVAARTT